MNQYQGRYQSDDRRPQYSQPHKRDHVVLTEDNYVDLAEQAINDLIARSKVNRNNVPQVVTTSKIRNLLAMTADIYNEVVNFSGEELPSEITGRINYLRVRAVYEAGRDSKVNDLVDAAQILDHIRDVKKNRKQYILFSRYMESLVAFRKFKVNDRDD